MATRGAALNYDADDLDNILKLQKSRRYIEMMQKVEDALLESDHKPKLGGIDNQEQLILDCHALSVEIENEIVLIHNFIRDKYGLKVAELESLVHHPIDYARAVKKVDLTTLVGDLGGLLPSAIIMVFSCWLLGKTIEACDRVLALDSAKKKVVDFFESRMAYVAPNLSAVVGSAVAAKLMNTAGGLSSLAKIPSSDVLVLGAKRKRLAQYSRVGGYIEQSEIIQTTTPPPSLRLRLCKLLAVKSVIAAHVDSARGYPIGEYGMSVREKILKIIEKWQQIGTENKLS